MEKPLEVLHVLGAFYLRLGNVPRALALTALAAESAPEDADVMETLVRCYIAAGEAEAALKFLDGLALRNMGRHIDRRLEDLRSKALWVAGRRDEARRLYARVLEHRAEAAVS
jgi:type III secretion protein Y